MYNFYFSVATDLIFFAISRVLFYHPVALETLALKQACTLFEQKLGLLIQVHFTCN